MKKLLLFKKMKGKFSLFMGLLLFSCINISAYDFESDGIFYNIIGSNQLEVTYKVRLVETQNYKGDLVIPEKVTYNNIGYSVTSIGDYAFALCSSLTSIDLPDSLTSISDYAFGGCSSLTSIDIPDAVTSVSEGAFYECSSLTSIDLPDSLTSIGDGAFQYCSALTSIDLPDSLTSIGNGAFQYCSALTSIDIPASGASIGDGAFEGCSSLTSIELPDSLTSISNDAFHGCSSLTSIDLPDSLTSIGNYAFSGCRSLTSINLPDSLTSIGDGAFNGCSAFTSIELPDSLTSISDDAFNGCSALTSIYLPDSLTSFGNYAFSGCSSLTSIDLPDSLTSIGDYAFVFCSSLTSIDIPASVTSIGDYAFVFCSSLTSIDIPASVTSIGNSTFEDCSSLTSINVNDVNQYYASLNGVLFNKDITTLVCYPAGIIETEYIIPNSITSIGDYAFSGCNSLKSVNLPDSLTSIGEWAFNGCSSLSSIDLPDSLTSIGVSAFNRCNSLTSVDLPDSLTSIGERAFNYCTSLTSVISRALELPEIGSDCFYGISSDAILYVYESVIEDYENSDWAQWFSEIIPMEDPEIKVTSIKISPEGKQEMTLGTTIAFIAIVLPENATDTTVVWTTDNEDVISIEVSDEDPNIVNIIAVKTGNATLIATAADGSGVFASVEITVVEPSFEEPEIYSDYVVKFNYDDNDIIESASITWEEEGDIAINTQADLAVTAVNKDTPDTYIVSSSVKENALILDFSKLPIGNYIITVPEGYVTIGANGINSEFGFEITVDAPTGIAGIRTDANGNYNVYRMSGEQVLSTKDASRLKDLKPGIYIINGKKVAL